MLHVLRYIKVVLLTRKNIAYRRTDNSILTFSVFTFRLTSLRAYKTVSAFFFRVNGIYDFDIYDFDICDFDQCTLIISIDEKLMNSIQFQFLLIFFSLPNGAF
jgi:hypothetical protein